MYSTNAANLLNKTKISYSKLSSYQDQGRATFTTNTSSGKQIIRNFVFKTFFERPSKFRFEWLESSDSETKLALAIRSNGRQVKVFSLNNEGWSDEADLERALDFTLYKTSGTPNIIAELLDICGKNLVTVCDASDSAIVAEEFIGSQSCLTLMVKTIKSPRLIELSVSDRDLLIRRIHEDLLIDPKVMDEFIESTRFDSIDSFRLWLMTRDQIPANKFWGQSTWCYDEITVNSPMSSAVFEL